MFPAKIWFPFSPTGENLIIGNVWPSTAAFGVASFHRRVDHYFIRRIDCFSHKMQSVSDNNPDFMSGIDSFSQTCKASPTTPLNLGGRLISLIGRAKRI